MKRFIAKWFYPASLILIILILIWQNYSPGTWLTGWDTLHPELNFKENFLRLFFGVWRSEQGLGAVAGHSHMADLPRVLLLWFWSFFLPSSLLRYAYIFFCLILGPIGIYYLIRYLLEKSKYQGLVAFLSSLVYLMNLATVQQFFVPFEMFPTQWAYLPWLMFFSIRFLKDKKKSWLLLYAITTLFATPQAYAAHLWYPFFGLYILFLGTYCLLNRRVIRVAVLLISVTVLVNSFWLLPNLYFIFNKGYVARENLNNQLYSQEFLAQNRATGTLANSALIKGFYFNWNVYDFQTQSQANLMQPWNDHLYNFDVRLVGYLVFAVSLFGLIMTFKKKQASLVALSPFFILSFIFMANRTFPFNWLFDLLLRFSFLEEVLRFSFSKITIVALFGFTVFFGLALQQFFEWIQNKRTIWFTSVLITGSLVLYFYPAFQGNLISKTVRQPIPQSYFDYWNYLQKQPWGRVLTLPLNNPAGWVYYDWYYQGSGLIWFGASQAVMDRDFDRWSEFNEQSYREFYNSLYTQNYVLFEQALSKYKINYILRDLSQNPAVRKNQDQITLRRETNNLFRTLQLAGKIRQVATFNNLLLYELNTTSLPVQLGLIERVVNPSYKWHLADWQYQSQDYISLVNGQANYYPFRQVFKQQNKIDEEAVSFFQKNGQLFVNWLGTNIKLNNYLVFTASDLKRANPVDSTLALTERGETLLFQSKEGARGVNLDLSNLGYSSAYLIAVKSSYLSGFPLRICFNNLFTKVCQINDQLGKNQSNAWDYFLIPGSKQHGQYELHLNALSYAGVKTQSEVARVLVIPIPIENLTKIVTNSIIYPKASLNDPENLQINWNNQRYVFTSNGQASSLVLWQAFDAGWKAYLNGRELKNHVLVNNWANGWQLPEGESGRVTIIFWPQYLQFIGFGLLALVLIWTLLC